MNKGFLSVVAVLILLAGGAWYVSSYVQEKPLTNEEDLAVREFVADFGATLQMVPLLGVERRAAMELYYAPFVVPELIGKWAPEGAEGALGRYSSSPYPSHIEVNSVTKTTPNSFVIEGTVVEVVNSGTMGSSTQTDIAATYPVTLTVRKTGEGAYQITAVTKGEYSNIPHRQSVVGFWECAPIKESYPKTEECITGIAIDQSDGHMIVDLGLMARAPVEYDFGTKVRIEGVVTPIMMLSTDRWHMYDVDAIVSATTIVEVE